MTNSERLLLAAREVEHVYKDIGDHGISRRLKGIMELLCLYSASLSIEDEPKTNIIPFRRR